MKFKYLFLSLATAAMVFAGCNPKEDLGPEEVTLSGGSTLELATEGQEVTLQLKATVDWQLQGYDADVQSWLVINPSNGKASKEQQTITVKALANADKDRTASIVFYGNILCKAPLTITQKGAKGAGEEYETITVAEFLKRKDAGTEYILKGTISDVSKNAAGTYWGFTLTDETGSVTCPFVENWDAFKLKNGDIVSIRGKYSYYESKQQDQLANGTIVEHQAVDTPKSEPKGTGTLEDPFNAAAANAKCAEIGSTASSEEYYVKGKIVSISKPEDIKQYGNATFYISDNGNSAEEQFYVFRVKYFGGEKFTSADQIKVGDDVVVKGKLINYMDNTPELNQGGQMISINGKSEGGETPGGGDEPGDEVSKPTSATKVTIKEFLSKPVNTTDWYELTGTITNIAGAQYGNLYIKDETDQVYIYGLTSSWADGKNDQSFSKIGLATGDVVTLWTLRAEYSGSAQGGGSIPALYISHTKGEEVTYPEGSVVLTFPDDNKNSNAVNDYVSTWTAKTGANEFTIVNFNNYEWNNWTYIKCGRKKNDSVASISNKTAVAAKISKVTVTADSYDASSMNSLVMNVYSDSELKNKLAEVKVDNAKQGDIDFAVPADIQAVGLYYSIVFDCKTSTASSPRNGFVQISKVVYLAAE